MARLTLSSMPIRITRDPTFPGRVAHFDMGDFMWREREGLSRSVSVAADVSIREVTSIPLRVFGYPSYAVGYVLEPGEEDKLPELPAGHALLPLTDFIELCDPRLYVLTLDRFYFERVIRDEIADQRASLPDYYTLQEDAPRIAWERLWGGNSAYLHRAVRAVFDMRSNTDCFTRFRDMPGETYPGTWVRDTQLPALAPRDAAPYGWALEEGGIDDVVQIWQRNSGREYYEDRLDQNLLSPALNRARHAFGYKLEARTGHVHVQRGRRLVLEHDERVSFPDTCKFDGFGNTFLAFNTRPNGGFVKPDHPHTFYQNDCVFIHREGGYTRFIFWEWLHQARDVAETLRYCAILPVMVADSECARSTALSPQRGMDPLVTRAIIGNPYFSSAMQHAFNRRAYLRRALPGITDPHRFNDVASPVLFRSGARNDLKGDRYSATGRKASREKTNRADVTTANLCNRLGPNEITFLPPVQRVAPDAEHTHVDGPVETKRRPLQLDM